MTHFSISSAWRKALASRTLRAALAALACLGGADALAQGAPATTGDLVQRGAYLAHAADCVACHTVQGGKPYAGNRPFALPFGTLYAPNVTPDKQTGIGAWTDDEFVKAMHEGIGKGGMHLYPAFPYASYTLMSREDVLAIKAYLFSLPPVVNPRRDNALSFPFNQRYMMVFWNLLFNPNKRFEADPRRSAEWNRGAYLVEGAGHCAECHSPRNLFQAKKTSEHLAGATTAGWKAYNITSDRDNGIGAWSDQDLSAYLASGHAPNHGSAAGPMAEAVNNSLRFLTPQDIHAMTVYLKTVPPRGVPGGVRVSHKSASNAPGGVQRVADGGPITGPALGEKIFASACVGCHRWDGGSAQGPAAALSGARSLNDPEALNLVQVVLAGGALDSEGGSLAMPAFAHGYSDAELAALANYVTGRFGDRASTLGAADIAKRRREANANGAAN